MRRFTFQTFGSHASTPRLHTLPQASSCGLTTSCSIIEHINKHEGVEWVTMEKICDDFKSQSEPPPGALMPAQAGEILLNPELVLQRKV